jgi:ribosomal protein L14E/L6E/L27E
MKQIDNFQVGSLVTSKAGRDTGRIYMILRFVDDNYVELVDGNHRKMRNPKLKKIKHLISLSITLEKIKTKLEENLKVFDTETYSAIKKALEHNAKTTNS